MKEKPGCASILLLSQHRQVYNYGITDMANRMNMETLEKILKGYGVKGAYLFGSQLYAGLAFLDGEVREIERGSDLDIGVVFECLPRKTYDVFGNLYAELSMLFEPFEMDLVFLQETSPLFQYEAITREMVFCGDESFCDEYEEKVMKMASDLSFKKAEFEKDFMEAVRDGYFEIAHREY
jgi:predicted nucleotidyltransferase